MLRINLDEENKYQVREAPSDFADDNSKGKIEKKAKRAEVKEKDESSREKPIRKISQVVQC